MSVQQSNLSDQVPKSDGRPASSRPSAEGGRDQESFLPDSFRIEVAETIVHYGKLLTARGYVCGFLGNIGVRVPHPYDPTHGVVYTKHGFTGTSSLSLEEMTTRNVVVTDIVEGKLLYGDYFPNEGHQLTREILRLRPDINAVIHVHPDEVVGFMAAAGWKEMRYVSRDLPLTLGSDVVIEHIDVNLELDPSPIAAYIANTNLVIMPNHGTSVLGRDVSQAYHRLNCLTSELRRIKSALEIAHLLGTEVPYIPRETIEKLHAAAKKINRNVGGRYVKGLW